MKKAVSWSISSNVKELEKGIDLSLYADDDYQVGIGSIHLEPNEILSLIKSLVRYLPKYLFNN